MPTDEILLKDNPDRFVILPIKYPDIWEADLEHKGAIWDINELDFSQDKHDWRLICCDFSANRIWRFSRILVRVRNIDDIGRQPAWIFCPH